ncbi:MAG: MBL fold metallo-hydrolase [bacterium]
MKITFYGGAGGVTGSKHLLEVRKRKILLDCGTWQGSGEARRKNRSFSFQPEAIDQVVLSHAHIDHCGMLPLLIKHGFKGSIFATAATKDVARLMLGDMAKIEWQDARYRQRHKLGTPDERLPLFDESDVEEVISRFVEVPYVRHSEEWHEVMEGVKLKLYDAGHILGSAICVLEFEEKGGGGFKRVAFSGDVGQPGLPLLFDPQVPEEEIETLLLESTYGSRVHESQEGAEERLVENITAVLNRGGKMIVPAFSLGRTQGIVYLLHKLTDQGRLPRFPIYVDSPLAANLTDVYRRHRREYDEESWTDFKDPGDRPLAFRNLRYTQSAEESKQLNEKRGPFMVIAASGMMSYGRVVHHLRQHVGNEKNAIFITGYQAQETMGRSILEGERRIRIFGDWLPVKAQVFLFNELSAHADRNQLQAYAERINGLQNVFLVHGEPHQADDLKGQLLKAHPEWRVERPEEGDVFEVLK